MYANKTPMNILMTVCALKSFARNKLFTLQTRVMRTKKSKSNLELCLQKVLSRVQHLIFN